MRARRDFGVSVLLSALLRGAVQVGVEALQLSALDGLLIYIQSLVLFAIMELFSRL